MRPISKTKSFQTMSPWHRCHCLHCQRLKFVLGIPKTSMDEIFIGTYSYKLGTGTPTFCTRLHDICTTLYHKPTLWYHGTTTLSPPSDIISDKKRQQQPFHESKYTIICSIFTKFIYDKVYIVYKVYDKVYIVYIQKDTIFVSSESSAA